MATNNPGTSITLNQRQQKFVDRFLSTESLPYQLLLAPVGSGKTILTVSVIDRLMRQPNAGRVLILTDRQELLYQYQISLQNFTSGNKIIRLDRKVVREVETLAGDALENAIALTTSATAIKNDVSNLILSSIWDLIVIDHSYSSSDSKQAQLLKLITGKAITKKLLILVSIYPDYKSIKEILGDSISQLEVTRWSYKDLTSSDKPMRKVKINIFEYQRTKEEVDFIKNYMNLSKLIKNDPVKKVRPRLVSSSLYAAEQSLRRYRDSIVHSDIDLLGEIELTLEEEDLQVAGNLTEIKDSKANNDLERQISEISHVLQSIDEIKVDSKFNALLSTLNPQGVALGRIWIYAAYRNTVDYLYSSLAETFINVHKIHGSMDTGSVSEAMERFRNEGGILIASGTALMGLTLSIDTLVLYDVPESSASIYQIISRFLFIPDDKSNDPVSIIGLLDKSGILSSENKRLKNFQDLVSGVFIDKLNEIPSDPDYM